MNNLLLLLSGARREILELCPEERFKFQSLGLAILTTSCIATVSMGFALVSAVGINPVIAVPFALGWGFVIMGIDRWLVISMPVGMARRLTMAVPRLALALWLGIVISTPLVLWIFQSDVNAQITVIKQQRATAYLVELEHSNVGKQIAYWQKDVANLQMVIHSKGQVALNPSTDLQLQSLTSRRAAEQIQEQHYYQQWQCQLNGGTGCKVKDDRPLAQASEKSYNRAAAQVATLTSQIQQRKRQLSATDAASMQSRYQQAQSALPSAEQQLSVAQAQQRELQQSFDAQNQASNGLLIRLEALNQVSGKDATLNAARFLVLLLFLVIECLPVTVKILQEPGMYEKTLQAIADRELRDAQKAYYSRSRMATGNMAPAQVPATTHAKSNSVGVRHVDLYDIWRFPTHVPLGPVNPPAEPTLEQSLVIDSKECAPPRKLELREMMDIRSASASPPADSDGQGTSIDLRYGDDDL